MSIIEVCKASEVATMQKLNVFASVVERNLRYSVRGYAMEKLGSSVLEVVHRSDQGKNIVFRKFVRFVTRIFGLSDIEIPLRNVVAEHVLPFIEVDCFQVQIIRDGRAEFPNGLMVQEEKFGTPLKKKVCARNVDLQPIFKGITNMVINQIGRVLKCYVSIATLEGIGT